MDTYIYGINNNLVRDEGTSDDQNQTKNIKKCLISRCNSAREEENIHLNN